jgi:hypothetical protein
VTAEGHRHASASSSPFGKLYGAGSWPVFIFHCSIVASHATCRSNYSNSASAEAGARLGPRRGRAGLVRRLKPADAQAERSRGTSVGTRIERRRALQCRTKSAAAHAKTAIEGVRRHLKGTLPLKSSAGQFHRDDNGAILVASNRTHRGMMMHNRAIQRVGIHASADFNLTLGMRAVPRTADLAQANSFPVDCL